MANRATVTYNGATISTEDKDGSFAITYNGSTLATLGAGQSKTLNCSGQPMKSDIVVGGKTLRCKNLKMHSDVVVSVKNLVDSVLANNSWATISAISRAGQAQQYWKVGDTKTFTCNGTTYTAQIIGFDHDDVSDSANYGRTKAGITFQFQELYNGTFKFSDVANVVRFTSSQMYSTHVPSIQSALESSLSAVLVGVTKPCIDISSSVEYTITDQKVTLASSAEIFGSASISTAALKNEGTQYTYYAAGNTKRKYIFGTTSYGNCWTRSCYRKMNAGVVPSGSESAGSLYMTNSMYVAPIFFV